MGDPFVCPGLSYAPNIEMIMLKHEGTLGQNSTKDDWLTSQHRDTLGSMIQHYDELVYSCMGENVHPRRMQRALLERLVQPLTKKRTRAATSQVTDVAGVVGPPPPVTASGMMEPPPLFSSK